METEENGVKAGRRVEGEVRLRKMRSINDISRDKA
jgi:hypothetical protein